MTNLREKRTRLRTRKGVFISFFDGRCSKNKKGPLPGKGEVKEDAVALDGFTMRGPYSRKCMERVVREGLGKCACLCRHAKRELPKVSFVAVTTSAVFTYVLVFPPKRAQNHCQKKKTWGKESRCTSDSND